MNHLFLVPNNQETTMTTREIAELTGKAHGDVMRDVRNMLADLEKDQSSFADIFLDSYNREQPCFNLPYDETVCLLTGYDTKARMRVIKRWKELESNSPPSRELTRMEILEIALESERERIRVTDLLAIAAPKADFADKYASATSGSKKFREVCKTLKVNERAFWEFLELEDIMYRLRKRQMAYQNHIDAGRFEVKTGVTDEGHAFNTVLFTPKGILWVAGEWAKFNFRGAA